MAEVLDSKSSTPVLWYLNAGFDLTLASSTLLHSDAGAPNRFEGHFSEMTQWYLLGALPADRVILDQSLLHTSSFQAYQQYCSTSGLALGSVVTAGEKLPGFTPHVWGWDQHALDRLSRYGISAAHPDLASVALVNGRAFCNTIAADSGWQSSVATECRSITEVLAALRGSGTKEAVIKPSYGNSGIGFVFVKSDESLEVVRARLAPLFTKDNATVMVQEWFGRRADISSHAVLNADGTISSPRHYQTFITSRGSFYGLVCDEENPVVRPWVDQLTVCIQTVAKGLFAQGYFGPFSIDSLITADARGTDCLIPLLEVNARDSMSFIGFSLRQRLAPGKPCLMRTLGRRKHELPGDYGTWLSMLGQKAFDPVQKRGILCATALRLETENGQMRQPLRSIFFVVGDTPADMHDLDAFLSATVKGQRTA